MWGGKMARLCGTKEKLKSRIASKVLRYPFFRPFGRRFLLDPGIHLSLAGRAVLDHVQVLLEVSDLHPKIIEFSLITYPQNQAEYGHAYQ